jgi:hypothetical protein
MLAAVQGNFGGKIRILRSVQEIVPSTFAMKQCQESGQGPGVQLTESVTSESMWLQSKERGQNEKVGARC